MCDAPHSRSVAWSIEGLEEKFHRPKWGRPVLCTSAIRAAMEMVAASLPLDELNRVGFRLCERFRPDVPVGTDGRGAKGELRIERTRSAVG
jgi:hypothetical protein